LANSRDLANEDDDIPCVTGATRAGVGSEGFEELETIGGGRLTFSSSFFFFNVLNFLIKKETFKNFYHNKPFVFSVSVGLGVSASSSF